jgi:DNA-binding transcriptional regulator YhcF (GntR family)
VEAVRTAIESGELREGERLPSIRTLARQLAINPNTVARAYRELEHRGLVTSHQGSGVEIRGGPVAADRARHQVIEAVSDAVRVLGAKETLRVAREAVRTARQMRGVR